MIHVWQTLMFPGKVALDIKGCGSKRNSLTESRNKEFIFTKTRLLAFFSKKLRRL